MSAVDSGALAHVPGDADPRVRELHAHWESLRPAPDLLPGRAHFDPVRVPHLLPNIWLLDIVGPPPRFRYRLIGTGLDIDRLAGATGRFMDEVSPDFPGSPTFADYLAVARGAISWRRGPPAFRFMEAWRVIKRLMLPLAADGRTPDMMLNITVVLESAPRPPRI
ncbi:MAG: PAS domain-containing protein [Tagaea sp.]|nr:PAS domain-containing protein [Tagaea sp.]